MDPAAKAIFRSWRELSIVSVDESTFGQSFRKKEKPGVRRPARGFEPAPRDQRFENWKLRRALRLPYFLRSTTRESRVRKPSFFKDARSSGS
jgi:hypothetical protein